MQTEVPGKVVEEGIVAIPAKIFRDYISSLHPGKITFTLEEDALLIKSGANTTTIQCIPPHEFPEFPSVEGESFTLPLLDLTLIDSQVKFAASLDLTRPILTSLLFSFSKSELLVVATDGFRLATLSLSHNSSVHNLTLLLPAKAIGEVVKTSTQLKVEVIECRISLEQKQVLFLVDKTKIYVRLIEGEYPPYQKIIPPDFKHVVALNGEELEDHLKRALIFSRDSSNIVKLLLSNTQLKLSAVSTSQGTHEGIMNVEVVKNPLDEELIIAFNARYILDFLSALKPETVEFSFNEPLTPALFKPSNTNGYSYIIMPFRVNE